MTDVAWVTLGLVVVTAGLVVATGIYVWFVFRQTKGIKELTLKQIRYQVEADITQIRLKRAEFLDKKGRVREDRKSPMDILNEREKQCKLTVDRIVEELRRLGVNS